MVTHANTLTKLRFTRFYASNKPTTKGKDGMTVEGGIVCEETHLCVVPLLPRSTHTYTNTHNTTRSSSQLLLLLPLLTTIVALLCHIGALDKPQHTIAITTISNMPNIKKLARVFFFCVCVYCFVVCVSVCNAAARAHTRSLGTPSRTGHTTDLRVSYWWFQHLHKITKIKKTDKKFACSFLCLYAWFVSINTIQ